MDELVVTCIQQQIRVFESHGEFRNDILRFMRLAKIKESHLAVFPELCGLMLAPPLVPGLKRTLLRVAERQLKKKPSIFDRMVGRLANSAGDMLGGISHNILEAFTAHADTLREAYLTIFSEIAREYGMYIVGGSIYLPDPADHQIRNTAYLFSPTGEIIGTQSKIHLSPTDRLFCQPAATGLQAFETDFGCLGILIGIDAMYPEAGRILGSLGANSVVHLVAAPGQLLFAKLRNAFAARLEENLLLGAQSCLVGKNILRPGVDGADFYGRSAILAPVDMTTRYSGSLGEVGSAVTDGVISATWDLKGLYELRKQAEVRPHEPLTAGPFRQQIQRLYSEKALPSTEIRPPGESIGPTAARLEAETGMAEIPILEWPATGEIALIDKDHELEPEAIPHPLPLEESPQPPEPVDLELAEPEQSKRMEPGEQSGLVEAEEPREPTGPEEFAVATEPTGPTAPPERWPALEELATPAETSAEDEEQPTGKPSEEAGEFSRGSEEPPAGPASADEPLNTDDTAAEANDNSTDLTENDTDHRRRAWW